MIDDISRNVETNVNDSECDSLRCILHLLHIDDDDNDMSGKVKTVKMTGVSMPLDRRFAHIFGAPKSFSMHRQTFRLVVAIHAIRYSVFGIMQDSSAPNVIELNILFCFCFMEFLILGEKIS